ncbi:hypothetical protein BKA70DRAFT_666898 [Coprinopsis sp. MPI-PUGE-AT-0042]|nr:hypothetical protein BKA70DRAFT_666898 [Coprinopsis sp. MPI-PUGE-AT-0042]
MAPKVPFWGAVMGVWTALRLKKEWDDSYAQVATDEAAEGGQIRLPNTPAPTSENEDAVSLLDPNSRRKEKRKARGCCMCCGVDCSLFWKVFGIVAGLWTVYLLLSGVQRMLSPTPSGLENMPAFGTSLGCENAEFFYKDSREGHSVSVPVSTDYHDHAIKLAGSGVGTLTIMSAPKDATEVTYNVIMRGSDRETMDRATVDIEEPDSKGMGRTLRFNTPAIPKSEIASGETCVRYDVTMSVPSSVKLLYIHSKAIIQIKFDEDAHLDLKELSVVLFKTDDKNMIIPSASVVSDSINFEVFKGWIVGETTVSTTTSVTTQRGDGVTNLKVHQVAPENPLNPTASVLRTTTGIGRTDVMYIANTVKRPIESRHLASMSGKLYLDYKQARFDGKIALDSKNFEITGDFSRTAGDGEWTHIGGSGEGKDRINVSSRGWTGLYL